MSEQVFDIKVWRSYYDQVNSLGQYLKDSRPDADGNPPKLNISIDERKQVEKEIEELLENCNNYLDKCKLYASEPKWIYNPRNETTWSSSEKFIFHHLMPKRKQIRIMI